ncbi:hypothetical protein XNC1_3064 [Xenorhabdus nematophila ATCC 19061]|uniref:Tail fiber assembly protein n=1 Tax=Xenorhabdus nematophila (strain ATCC 19061 / DSM 3370 / CCUG 14189 / LMG 1036 / NCIMB 9965 / AN6) TaxID=406817 RepID=D3VKL0_XENNA|nr:tail fiber assembly protein [Xenorhabdus nematophila]CBJ91118.1 hypothetical protein XNC1_3064 [Xenorhabdus nematophila ATCC 19061]CEK23940.1 hypothetical protein XNC2_2946 [Xenorhabdus nematophila AN6/1]
MKNYYFDETQSHRPFTFITEASPGSYPPDNAIRTAPQTRNGYWPCLIDGQWELLPDHRGKIVYSTTTRQSLRCEEVIMPEGYTDLVPQTLFDNWDGKDWVTDLAAQQVYDIQRAEDEKRQLLRAATEKIAICQDAIELGMAMEEEQASLMAWRKYRIRLSRVDCSLVPDIAWPKQPK